MKGRRMSPRIEGLPIEITFWRTLRAHRGKLLVGEEERGREVHAASFLRRRRIVLDSDLLKRLAELRRIPTHELFHFAWVRLGNPRRQSFERLLQGEMRGRVRGELGWSAEHLKTALDRGDPADRTRRWRGYVCESFCDTGAWMFSSSKPRHGEFTLSARARRKRREWFENLAIILV